MNQTGNNSEAKIYGEMEVGRNIREIRTDKGMSLKSLALRSGVPVETLRSVENGKTSPTLVILHQLSSALDVPFVSLINTKVEAKKVVYTPANLRTQTAVNNRFFDYLGNGLATHAVQPFVVTLNPVEMGEENHPVAHLGFEFIYCLDGEIHYQVDGVDYALRAGDSLVFEAQLPHFWENTLQSPARMLLILVSTEGIKEPNPHQGIIASHKESATWKLAVATEDEKTVGPWPGAEGRCLALTIDGGRVTRRESRVLSDAQTLTGTGPDTVELISDCKVLISGMMGREAYEDLNRRNIRSVVTRIESIEDAVQAFLDGKLIDHASR